MLDSDMMSYTRSLCAADRSVCFPDVYHGCIMRIYTENIHPGYVKLIREKDNIELLKRVPFSLNTIKYQSIHGPALLTDDSEGKPCEQFSRSNDADDAAASKRYNITKVDSVPAIHCPYWPMEASEWITRRRCHGYPSKPVIKQVVSYGCDFVQVSHKLSSDTDEYRYSFSKAELHIIKSWTISQKIVYSTLWALNKKIASSNLCTYYFKTLMFWACEEKQSDFWSVDLLVQSVRELVIIMIK